MSNFQKALKRVLKHEGGYVNHPRDPGGETNYGVTKRTAQSFGYNSSMRNIPMSTVEAIYESMYWDALDCDNYPFALSFQLFDAGVNHGNGNARRILQRAVGVVDDGIIGGITKSAIRNKTKDELVSLFNAERLRFYTRISTFNTFGRGWARRVATNLDHAAEDLA